MNICLLLVALPVLCTPTAGSLLRFPNTDILSFTSEAVTPGSFDFRGQPPRPEAWLQPEKDYGIELELPPLDFSITTDLAAEAVFGPTPKTALNQAAILDPAPFPVHSGPPDLLFFLIGISACSVRFILGSPQSRRTRVERERFSSQLPQIIHLTRPARLP